MGRVGGTLGERPDHMWAPKFPCNFFLHTTQKYFFFPTPSELFWLRYWCGTTSVAAPRETLSKIRYAGVLYAPAAAIIIVTQGNR